MRWSKLRKLVEDSFAESVRGRVHVYSTRYQCSCGRGWLTIDGEELANLCSLLSGSRYRAFYHETTKTECRKHPAVKDEERKIGNAVEPGEFSRFDLYEACWAYVHSNVNDSLKSENPLVVSLAVLDYRVGKGRLRKLSAQPLHPLTSALLDFRMKVEHIA
jgi:hypothetical protein